MKRVLWSGTGISTALSLILAVGLAVATSMTVQIAVVVGLLSTLIGLAITGYVAIDDRLNQIDASRIGALPLQRLLTIPKMERPTVRLIDAAATVTQEHGAFMESLACETLDDAMERMEGIADGSVCFDPADEVRLVRRALDHATDQVRAVAARGPEWWLRPEADVYWRAYGQAATRLSIERIFVLHGPIDADMRRVLERHHREGMKTFVVDAALLPANRIEPIVLFDRELLHRHAARRHAEEGYRIEFSDRPDDIIRAEENYSALLGFADEWTPEASDAAATAA